MTSFPVSVCLVASDTISEQLESLATQVSDLHVFDQGLDSSSLERLDALNIPVHDAEAQSAATLIQKQYDETSSSWLLVLMESEMPENLTLLDGLESQQADVISVYTENKEQIQIAPRLFKTGQGLNFQGVLPELLDVTGEVAREDWLALRLISPDEAPLRGEEEIAQVVESLNEQPDQPAWIFWLGHVYFQNQQDNQALKYFRQLTKREDKQHFYTQVGCLFYLKVLWEMKQREKAFEQLQTFSENYPEMEQMPGLWVLRGVISHYFGEKQLARDCFDRALALPYLDGFYPFNRLCLKPDITWKPLVGLSEFYLEEGLYAQALQVLEQALPQVPEQMDLRATFVKAAFFSQHYDKLMPYLEVPIPGLSEAEQQVLKYLSHRALKHQVPPQETIDSQNRLILDGLKTNPQNAFLVSLMLEYSISLLQHNFLVSAREMINALLPYLEKEGLLWHNLAYSYFAEGNFEQASRYYLQALQYNPHLLESRFDLGKVRVMMGDREGAKKEFETILHMQPQHQLAQQALKQLQAEEEAEFIPVGLPMPSATSQTPPESQQEAPYIFVFPLEPIWENGIDIVLKAFQEEFTPEDQVILALPVAEANSAIQAALEWAESRFPVEFLPPVIFLDKSLPLLEERSCWVLPYRIAPQAELLQELCQTPYPGILPQRAGVHQGLSMDWVAETESQQERRIWQEAKVDELRTVMRQALGGKLSPLSTESTDFQYQTHHFIQQAQAVQPDKITLPAQMDTEAAKLGISVCMIIKDEARFLQRCLDSVHAHVDEVIVVDTGSTDGSQEIARQFEKVKLTEVPWEGSFSQARNLSLAQATQPWILCLDGDEYVPPHFIQTLRMYLGTDQGEMDAYVFPVEAVNAEGEVVPDDSLPVPRVFRNQPVYRFQGRIHEMLKHQDRSTMNYIYLKGLPIYHQGYQTAVREEKNKWQRDADLMVQMVQEEPDSPETARLYHILGKLYEEKGALMDALNWYEQGLEQVKNDERIREILTENRLHVLLDQGQTQTVIQALENQDSLSLNQHFMLGLAHEKEGALGQALLVWENTLAQAENQYLSPDPLNISVRRSDILRTLARGHAQQNNILQAQYYLKRYLKLNREDDALWKVYEDMSRRALTQVSVN